MIEPMTLAYLPQNNPPALLDWLREHGNLHKAIGRHAIEQGISNLVTYAVYDMADRNDWLYFHYQEHVNIASTFSTGTPPDLSYWDENDPVNFGNWLNAHALTHQQIRDTLKL